MVNHHRGGKPYTLLADRHQFRLPLSLHDSLCKDHEIAARTLAIHPGWLRDSSYTYPCRCHRHNYDGKPGKLTLV